MRSHCPTGCAPSPPLQLPSQAPMSVAASCVAPPTAFEMPSCSSCGSGSPWLACTVLAALQPNYVTVFRRRRELILAPIAVLPIHRHRWNARCTVLCDGLASAATAQLVARRSHNPKVVGSILTCRMPRARAVPAALVPTVHALRRGLSRNVPSGLSLLAVCQVEAGGPHQSPKQPGRTSSVDACGCRARTRAHGQRPGALGIGRADRHIKGGSSAAGSA